MDSVIISDYGVMLAKTGDRLVVRGPKPNSNLSKAARNSFSRSASITIVPPNLDWRIQAFEAGTYTVAFDGAALLLLELWIRSSNRDPQTRQH